MVHRQANHAVGYPCGHRQVLRPGRLQAAVGGEVRDERVEVAAAQDTVLLHLEVKLVARHTVGRCVDEHGEVGVVVAHAGHVLHHTQAGDSAKGLAVAHGHAAAGGDGGIHLAQVQQAVGRAHLVHLAVDAGGYHRGLARKAEVLQVVDALLRPLVVAHQRTTLHRVVHLRGVEAERGHVARLQNGLAVHLHAEGMGGVVDHLQAVLVGHGLDACRVARLAVHVHGHDGRRARRDGCLYLVRVEVARLGVDVHEHGLDAVPPQSVRRGHEAVGRGDDLARDAQGLQGAHQRERAVGEQADVGNFQVLAQGALQLPVVVTVVGEPLAVPDVPEHGHELLQRGEKGGSDRNEFFFHDCM